MMNGTTKESMKTVGILAAAILALASLLLNLLGNNDRDFEMKLAETQVEMIQVQQGVLEAVKQDAEASDAMLKMLIIWEERWKSTGGWRPARRQPEGE